MFCSTDTYRKTWNIKEEFKIQSLIIFFKNRGVQWYIGLVVKNNLYHDGELIQERFTKNILIYPNIFKHHLSFTSIIV